VRRVVRKDQCDAFAANPDLAHTLRAHHVNRLVVAGMQSDYCIREASRGAMDAGFEVLLPRGAHATYDDKRPAAEVSRAVEQELRAAGVHVVDMSDVQF